MNEWIDEYLDSLPTTIRTGANNTRLLTAAAAAAAKGWTGKQAAHVIRSRNYTTKRNPPLIALMELETLSTRPPATSRPATSKTNPSGCLVCPPGPPCTDPVTELTPTGWVAERVMLVKQLTSRGITMTEDERDHAMASLIDRQRYADQS